MGKAALVAIIGVGGATVAVGGVYLSGLFSTMDASLPESVDKLKEYGNKGCIGYLFPKLDFSGTGSSISNTDKVDNNTFPKESSKPGASCLTVNWEKKTYSDNKKPWTGSFRWLWGFVQGDKGFIIFATATPSTANEKELTLSGVFYLMNREENKGWKIEKNKNIESNKKINKDDFDNVFPKVGASLKAGQAVNLKDDYWGFVSGKDEMDNACKKGDSSTCKGDPKTDASFKGLWLMESFDDKKNEMKKWSENVDTILSKLFTSSEIDLTNVLSTQGGEWKVKVIVSPSTPSEEASSQAKA